MDVMWDFSQALPRERHDIPYDHDDIKKSDTINEEVLTFLDRFFSIGDIDLPGDAKDIRYTRMPFTMVYDKYLEYCKKLSLEPLQYIMFCSIRLLDLLVLNSYN